MPRRHPGTGRAFGVLRLAVGRWVPEADLIAEARLGSKSVPAETVLARVLSELDDLGWPVEERTDATGRAFRIIVATRQPRPKPGP